MAHLSSLSLIPSGPLVSYEELIHKDLQEWSNDLYQDIQSLPSKIKEDPSEACVSLNQAALVSALHGDLESAMNLCHIQIKWLVNLSSSQALTANHLLSILQPWINMGRLYNIKGKYNEAMSHFDMVDKARNQAPLDLIYIQVGSEQFQELLACKENGEVLRFFIWINYINEIIKLKIKSRDFSGGFLFLNQQKEEAPFDFSDLFKESEIILLEYTEAYDTAIHEIQNYRPKSAFGKLIFLYHLALTHHLNDTEDLAKKHCLRLASYLERAMNEVNFVKLKRLMHLAGELCFELGLDRNSYAIHLKGYELSKKLGDHRYATRFAVGFSKFSFDSPVGHGIHPPVKSTSMENFNRLNTYIIREFG